MDIEISSEILQGAVAGSLLKGELGDKVADRVAHIYAEVTSYNRTDAAQVLNISRSTLYEYESDSLLAFGPDGRISLADLLKFRRSRNAPTGSKPLTRKSHKNKRRALIDRPGD